MSSPPLPPSSSTYVNVTSSIVAPPHLSATNPLLSSNDFSLSSAMTALEAGCDKMDVPVQTPPVVHLILDKLPTTLDGTTISTVEEALSALPLSTLLSPTLPTISTVKLREELNDLDTFTVFSKLMVRMEAWLLGRHTLSESLYTYVPPAYTAPSEINVLTIGVQCISHFVDIARDCVWYADVYEEEDIALGGFSRSFSGDKTTTGVATADDEIDAKIEESLRNTVEERLLAPSKISDLSKVVFLTSRLLLNCSFVLRATRDVDVLHMIDLKNIYEKKQPNNEQQEGFGYWEHNIGFLRSLLVITQEYEVLLDETLLNNSVVLPDPPPTPEGTTYVDVATTTFGDGDFFTNTNLLLSNGGAPSRACTFNNVKEAYHNVFSIMRDIRDKILGKLTVELMSASHGIEVFGDTPKVSVLPRSVFALCSYSRSQRVLGRLTIPEMTGKEMLALGVAQALMQLPQTIAFAADLGRLCYDRVRHLAWNDSRRRDMLLVDTVNDTYRSARVADDVVGRELGLPSCRYMATVACIHGCNAIIEFLTTMGVDGIACNNGYEGSVYEWLLEYYMKIEEENRGVAQRTRDALESARIDAEIEKERESFEEAARAASASKAAKSSSKKKGGKGKDKGGAGFVPRPMETYISDEDRKLKLLHNVQSYFLAARLHCHRGTFRFYEGLKAHGVIPPTSYVFTTPEVVYDRTYAKLADVEYPPRPTHKDYQEGSVKFPNDVYKAEDLFNMTTECYQEAARVLEHLSSILVEENRNELDNDVLRFDTLKADLKEIKKTIVMNKIQMSKVATLEKNKVRKVTIERRAEAKGLGVVNIP